MLEIVIPLLKKDDILIVSFSSESVQLTIPQFFMSFSIAFYFRQHSCYLSDGAWSPVRPAVFFTTKVDGTLDIWDYLYKQNEPTLTVQVIHSLFLFCFKSNVFCLCRCKLDKQLRNSLCNYGVLGSILACSILGKVNFLKLLVSLQFVHEIGLIY